MDEIRLEPITKQNWYECTKRKVRPDQETYIFPNVFSLAQYQFMENFRIRAIYHGPQMIGFAMYGLVEKKGQLWIYRFMIDGEFQDRGFGRAAFELVMDKLKSWARSFNLDSICLSYELDNEKARRFYRNAGFIPTGELDDGEEVASIQLDAEA